MVYDDNFMDYPNRKIYYTVHTYDYENKLGTVVSENNKIICFLSKRLSKSLDNHNTTDK